MTGLFLSPPVEYCPSTNSPTHFGEKTPARRELYLARGKPLQSTMDTIGR